MIFHFYCDFWKFCHPKMLFQNFYWYISPLNLDSGHFLISTFWSISAAAAKSLQSCPTLCNPIDGSPPGSPIPGILQARTLEWVAISFSNAWKWKVKVKCPTLSDPMDCSLPGSSVHEFSRQEYWSGVPLPSQHCTILRKKCTTAAPGNLSCLASRCDAEI